MILKETVRPVYKLHADENNHKAIIGRKSFSLNYRVKLDGEKLGERLTCL